MGEVEYEWRILRKALTLISMFFKDGLEKFEVNRNVQISIKKKGLRIDAETTANRLLEGTINSYLIGIVGDSLHSDRRADPNVGRAIWA